MADKMKKSNKEMGAQLMEYALAVGLILIVALAGVKSFSGEVDNTLNRTSSELAAASS